MAVHDALARGRWFELSVVEQLANVGSEVERAIRSHQSGRHDRFERALDRALELFDMTAADGRNRGPRRREVLRAREEFCTLFFGEAPADADIARVRRYFLQFAVAARAGSSRTAGRGA